GGNRGQQPRRGGAGFAARRRTPPPSGLPRAITSRQAVEGGGHGTQATRAQLHWRIGATDLLRGPLQVHRRIGAAHPGTGRRRDKQGTSEKEPAAVPKLQDRSERRGKLAEIGSEIGARPRPWTATCEPTETRSETDVEDSTRRTRGTGR